MNEGSSKFLGAAVLIGVLVVSLIFNQPPPNIAGQESIPRTMPSFNLKREAGSGHGKIVIKDTETGATLAQYGLDRNGRLHQSPEQASGRYRAEQTPFYFLADPALDLGTWGGFWSTNGEQHRSWQAGLRVSPVRLLYDTLSPEAVVSADAIGVGVTAYPPESFGDVWKHFGVGVWYLAPFDGVGGGGWAAGVAFSARGGE